MFVIWKAGRSKSKLFAIVSHNELITIGKILLPNEPNGLCLILQPAPFTTFLKITGILRGGIVACANVMRWSFAAAKFPALCSRTIACTSSIVINDSILNLAVGAVQ
jgi:hypothetical protein